MRRSTLIRAFLAIVFSLGLGLMISAPALGAGASQVSGVQSPDTAGTCPNHPDSVFTTVMSGSLVGCWYIDTITNEKTNPGGADHFSGTETFVGCIGGACGTLRTTFKFTGKFSTSTGIEAHGRCHHPIVAGTGDFAGATGLFTMHDQPDGTAIYRGHVKY